MKKTQLTLLLMFITIMAFGQDTNKIESTGNIGIGTTTPSTLLDVNGTARFGLSNENGIQISRFTTALTDVPGSTGGIQLQGPVNAHVVLDIKGNDLNDGFYIRIPTTLQANPTVDKTAFVVKSNSRIGIGTTNPDRQLEISSSLPIIRLKHSLDGSSAYAWLEFNDVNSRMGYIGFGSSTNNHLYLMNEANGSVLVPNGNLGIGTTSPTSSVHIERKSDTYDNMISFTHKSSSGSIHSTWDFQQHTNGNMVLFNSNNKSLFLNTGGSFGIGTTTTGSHKLAVNGSIGAREIKVEATPWPDFVFENDYKLRTLKEVEQHINDNGHLPDIPSTEEVIENGIYLGEMNAKLLQKIEELTLYLIEQNKKIERLEEEVTALKESVH